MSAKLFKEKATFCFVQNFITITITGKDAECFLQNLITNDIRLLTKVKIIRSIIALTTGKIAFDVFIQKLEKECFQILIIEEQCERLQKHLEFFHILEELKIEKTKQKKFYYLLFCSNQEAKTYQYSKPTEIIETGEKYICLETKPTKEEVLLQNLRELNKNEFENVRAFFKIAKNSIDFGEKRLPQEAGFRKIINFKKGCFVGQEAIARLEHKGKVVRTLSQFICLSPLEKKQKLVSKNSLVGSVTSSCPYPYCGNYYALGYLKTQPLLDKEKIYLDKKNTLVQVYPLEKLEK